MVKELTYKTRQDPVNGTLNITYEKNVQAAFQKCWNNILEMLKYFQNVETIFFSVLAARTAGTNVNLNVKR